MPEFNLARTFRNRGLLLQTGSQFPNSAYYTPSAENQLHFWGQADRIAYIKAINDVLSDYIEPIVLEKEETK